MSEISKSSSSAVRLGIEAINININIDSWYLSNVIMNLLFSNFKSLTNPDYAL